jgi:chromosomal replication initiator protein
VNEELDGIWALVQAELAASVDGPTYRTWLAPLRLSKLQDGHAEVLSCAHSRRWIHERFGRLLESSLQTVLGTHTAVVLTEPATNDDHSTIVGRARAGGAPTHARGGALATGNPRYTFDRFVIGDCNRLAHAAALTVAEMPGQAYNPLFVCGPPGVGKSHLMHAIAGMLNEHNPGISLVAATGESFTNEFQLALGNGAMDRFKDRFRHVDVLLLDDVQFLERKTKTEEEFFHTFNSLHEAGAQIVLTSDRPPRDLQALEDRLRERFEAGLVADIAPPDYSTRLAILRKRALEDGLQLPDQTVLEVIARRAILNVRALEGALIRTVAYASLAGKALTPQLAEDVLGALYPQTEPHRHSIADIQAAACQHFGLTGEELLSPSRAARVAWPRQVAMYLARELTDDSLPAIGRSFGGRDHTTVLHAWRRTGERLRADQRSRTAVEKLRVLLDEQAHTDRSP